MCDQVRACEMADQLIFYTYPMSRGRIVRWILEEIGRPYRTELLDYDQHDVDRLGASVMSKIG